jgi:uncharacterized protein
MVMPSEWLRAIVGEDREWNNREDLQMAFGRLMMVYNEVAGEILANLHNVSILIDRLGESEETFEFAHDWCRGYVYGMAMRADDWQPLQRSNEFGPGLNAIARLGAGEDDTQALRAFGPAAVALHAYWRQRLGAEGMGGTSLRAEPKVPRNAPCLCGSGKKYKRCCGSPLRAI